MQKQIPLFITIVCLLLAGLYVSPTKALNLPVNQSLNTAKNASANQVIDTLKTAKSASADQVIDTFRTGNLPPMSHWKWYYGKPDCELTPLAKTIHDAVDTFVTKRKMRKKKKGWFTGDQTRFLRQDLITTKRNAVGPAMMDSPGIFSALGRIIEEADYEFDLLTFFMEHDSDPYKEILNAFKKRLSLIYSTRPLPGKVFRIRIFANAISPLNIKGSERTIAKKLITPYMNLLKELNLDPEVVQIEVATHVHGARGAIHDKLGIVDGSYLHIGGANIQNKNNYDNPERDSGYILKGDIATQAMESFDTLWRKRRSYCKVTRENGKYLAVCELQKGNVVIDRDKNILKPQYEKLGLGDKGCIPMTILSKRKKGFLDKQSIINSYSQGLLAGMGAAKSHLKMTSPNLNSPHILTEILKGIKDRNIRYDILLPYKRNLSQVNNIRGFGSNELSLQRLRACSMRNNHGIFDNPEKRELLNPRWWVKVGDEKRDSGNGPGCYHIKYSSIDDQVAIIGSGNLDGQAMYHSSETSIVVNDPVIVETWDNFIFTPEYERAVDAKVWQMKTPKRWSWRSPKGWLGRYTDHFNFCKKLEYNNKY